MGRDESRPYKKSTNQERCAEELVHGLGMWNVLEIIALPLTT